jgi:hypothetical protein
VKVTLPHICLRGSVTREIACRGEEIAERAALKKEIPDESIEAQQEGKEKK